MKTIIVLLISLFSIGVFSQNKAPLNISGAVQSDALSADTVQIGVFYLISDADSMWVESPIETWYSSIKQFIGGSKIDPYWGFATNSGDNILHIPQQTGDERLFILDNFSGVSIESISDAFEWPDNALTLYIFGQDGIKFIKGNNIGFNYTISSEADQVSIEHDGTDWQLVTDNMISEGSLTDGAPTKTEINTVTGLRPDESLYKRLLIKDTDGTMIY